MSEVIKAYQIQFNMPDGNHYVEWVKGERQDVDEYIGLKCKRKSWTLDEIWSYESDDPRVNMGSKGMILYYKSERHRNFLEEVGLEKQQAN